MFQPPSWLRAQEAKQRASPPPPPPPQTHSEGQPGDNYQQAHTRAAVYATAIKRSQSGDRLIAAGDGSIPPPPPPAVFAATAPSNRHVTTPPPPPPSSESTAPALPPPPVASSCWKPPPPPPPAHPIAMQSTHSPSMVHTGHSASASSLRSSVDSSASSSHAAHRASVSRKSSARSRRSTRGSLPTTNRASVGWRTTMLDVVSPRQRSAAVVRLAALEAGEEEVLMPPPVAVQPFVFKRKQQKPPPPLEQFGVANPHAAAPAQSGNMPTSNSAHSSSTTQTLHIRPPSDVEILQSAALISPVQPRVHQPKRGSILLAPPAVDGHRAPPPLPLSPTTSSNTMPTQPQVQLHTSGITRPLSSAAVAAPSSASPVPGPVIPNQSTAPQSRCPPPVPANLLAQLRAAAVPPPVPANLVISAMPSDHTATASPEPSRVHLRMAPGNTAAFGPSPSPMQPDGAEAAATARPRPPPRQVVHNHHSKPVPARIAIPFQQNHVPQSAAASSASDARPAGGVAQRLANAGILINPLLMLSTSHGAAPKLPRPSPSSPRAGSRSPSPSSAHSSFRMASAPGMPLPPSRPRSSGVLLKVLLPGSAGGHVTLPSSALRDVNWMRKKIIAKLERVGRLAADAELSAERLTAGVFVVSGSGGTLQLHNQVSMDTVLQLVEPYIADSGGPRTALLELHVAGLLRPQPTAADLARHVRSASANAASASAGPSSFAPPSTAFERPKVKNRSASKKKKSGGGEFKVQFAGAAR